MFTCANFSDIRYQKSIGIEKVISDVSILEWHCVRYLIIFLLFTAKFRDIGKHEKVTWKGISDLSFRDWDCVRFLSIFLLSTVQTSQTLGNKNELLQMPYLIYHQFPNETVSGKVSIYCCFWWSANSLYIAQQKLVPWKDMPEKPVFDWYCQVFGHPRFLYGANFLDVGQEKGVKTRCVWHINFWMRLCQAFDHFPVVHSANFSDIGQERRTNMWRNQYFNDFVSRTYSFSGCLLCKLLRH